MTITSVRAIRLNPVWPKYRMVCGEIIRILSEQEPPERLIGSQWEPDHG